MPERERKKKGGEAKSHKNRRQNGAIADPRQGVDKPNVKEPRKPDEYRGDLKKAS